jgi:hypothetical protein
VPLYGSRVVAASKALGRIVWVAKASSASGPMCECVDWQVLSEIDRLYTKDISDGMDPDGRKAHSCQAHSALASKHDIAASRLLRLRILDNNVIR